MEEIIVKVDGKEYKILVEETDGGKILVHVGNEVYEVEAKQDVESTAIERLQKQHGASEGKIEITAPLPGVVTDVKAKEGAQVKEGQGLVTLMAMKMENEIISPKDGVIKEIRVKKDDNVNKGDLMIVIE